MRRMILACLAAVGMAAGLAHAAEEAVTYPFPGSFEDATFAVESEILDRGLVVDHVSHVGEMLARTAADVGASRKIFEQADVFLFCSAVLSRKVMEVDPLNIVHCPYGIFVADIDGKVIIGHRAYPEGEMKEVEAFLADIARAAVAQ